MATEAHERYSWQTSNRRSSAMFKMLVINQVYILHFRRSLLASKLYNVEVKSTQNNLNRLKMIQDLTVLGDRRVTPADDVRQNVEKKKATPRQTFASKTKRSEPLKLRTFAVGRSPYFQ